MKDVTSRNNLERVLMRNAELVRTRRAAAKKARGGSSASSAPKVGGVSTPCHVCKEPVYAAERLVVDQASEQLVLHRRCFRCKFCKQIVKFGNFSAVDGVFYCLPHFKQLFQEQGGSYANMGDGQAKGGADVKPTPSAIASKFTKAHDKCAVCDAIVYPTDQVILEKGSGDKALLHKACLKCSNCSTKLTQATYMLVTVDDKEKYFCKRHGKEATEAALIAKQAQFEGATNMYAAFGKEYGQEAAAKKAHADGESANDAGDVRVDDAVRSAMSKLRTAETPAPAASSGDSTSVSEAEKAIAASAKRREKAAEADSEVSAIEADRERRRREREDRQKEIEVAAAREEQEAAARREERRRARAEADASAEAEAAKLRDEREAARVERQRVTDASRAADSEAEERAAERERERAKRRAALEAETAATERALEERRAARQKEREERDAREKAEEAERQRKREERRAATSN